MPCNGGHSYPASCNCNTEALIEEIDELTQFLCYLCGETIWKSDKGKLEEVSPTLVDWWRKHDAQDRRRVGQQMDRRLAKQWCSPKVLAAEFIRKAEKVHPVSSYHKYKWFIEMAEKANKRYGSKQEKRVTKEQLREGALAKLNDDERKALGIKASKKRKKRRR